MNDVGIERAELNKLLTDCMVFTNSGMKLYSVEVMVKILRQLQQHNLFVSGIDCIILHDDGSVQPDSLYDHDFSFVSFEHAINNIQPLDSKYCFELLDDVSDVPVYSIKISIEPYEKNSEWKSHMKKEAKH